MKRIKPTKPLLKPTARDLTTNRVKKPRVIIKPKNTSMKFIIVYK